MTDELKRALRPRALPFYDEAEISALVNHARAVEARAISNRQAPSEKSIAGTASGKKRKSYRDLRLNFVKAAFDRLKKAYQGQPFSDDSIDALQEEYQKLFGENAEVLLEISPFKASRKTLKKDMKALGIRSKRRR
jgi:histone H3/H4